MVIIGASVSEFEVIQDNFADLALATLTLNLAAMTISYTIARVARLSDAQSTAIALELGVHNGTLAIAVASTVDNTPGHAGGRLQHVHVRDRRGSSPGSMYQRSQRAVAQPA